MYSLQQPYSFTLPTGAVRTRGRLDYEQVQQVVFHVQVQDTGSPQLSALSMATVTVDVTDINDCPPQFSQPEYSATLLLPTYNNVSVIQVRAHLLTTEVICFIPRVGC